MSVLQLTDVSKRFGSGTSQVTALKDVNFTADNGELVLIVGPSGSGKSTFLTILGGLQQPTSGQVKIQNQAIHQLSKRALEKIRLNEIGFVLQAYNLVPYLTVTDQFKLVDQVKKSANLPTETFQALLNELGIEPLLKKYPDELSGGQAQRVAIARALYANPNIILADEPTAALDTARVEEVGRMFAHIAHQQKKAVIVVTHDTRLETYADKIYNITDGKLSQVK
ncbi:ABC transporter ATP-binding protein [Weissella halotolerans]|uniref:Putative hemin import ATP-binding protein HrtA n=1 Tax=Weissella halotolerans DSM 20190 TaxID=1123500 RepID=A0A0R2G1T2_9LACO|nr:ABC transporter ATP-binding protein [Weissella halotolerans]KRN32261.1 resistance ABC superfamily ATP binding cassette transporter, binding protein [Weissella halotolerans DSM 20190]